MTLRLVRTLPGIFLVGLIAGCHTPGAGQPPASTSADTANGEAALQRRAEASAHFAAAVIHLLNDEPAEAAEDFDQATRQDPANEALALEVSRRLVQMRQPERAREIIERAAARPHAQTPGFVHEGRAAAASRSCRVAPRPNG